MCDIHNTSDCYYKRVHGRLWLGTSFEITMYVSIKQTIGSCLIVMAFRLVISYIFSATILTFFVE